MLWKGAPSTPLSTIATIRIVSGVLERNGLPGAVTALCQGGDDIGKKMSNDPRVKLVSFTGSTNAGKHVAMAVQSRLPNNTGLNFRLPAEIAAGRGRFPAANEN